MSASWRWGLKFRFFGTSILWEDSRGPRKQRRAERRGITYERLEDRRVLAGLITQVDYFDTWNGGLIQSTDVAGITFQPSVLDPPGHLYLADSEINETPQFQGNNIFGVSLDGQQLLQEIASNNKEPTGITYNEFDGFFYVTNDDNDTIQRYDSNLNNPLATVFTAFDDPSATDPEGITSDPSTGYLYVVDAHGGGTQVLAYDSDLVFAYSFPVSAQLFDPEGIAFNPDNNHLFLVSGADDIVAEYALNGAFVEQYDISGLTPAPQSPQGLSFAPTSDPFDDPSNLALYIADGGFDNVPDGGIYEVVVSGGQLAQNTAPLVTAGGNQDFLLSSFPMNIELNASVADDGLPDPPSTITTLWSQVSGPGTVSFADATAVDPTVTFPAAGTYVLRLTADDGDLITSDDATIVVKQGVEIRVTASSDDAEERIATGKMFLTGADLDLGTDAGGTTTYDQIVGLRFSGVSIPQGATIENAYVQFRADETDATVTSLTIEGEDVDDAPTFASANGDISSRSRTISSVAWSPAPWTKGDAGLDQQTPNIASIIQHIVDRPAWSSGNALVVVFSGIGERVAEPFDSGPTLAPELVVEFVTSDYPPGDFNEDGNLDANDIDLLFDAVNAMTHDLFFDLTGEGEVNALDVDELVRNILGTEYGDANLDGKVNSSDAAILGGNFGTLPGATWAMGSFNGDGQVNSSDAAILGGHFGFNNTAASSASGAARAWAPVYRAVRTAASEGSLSAAKRDPAVQRAALAVVRLLPTEIGPDDEPL